MGAQGWFVVAPMLVLLAASVVLPLLLVPRATLSHRRLAFGILAAAGALIVLGMGLFAWLYAQGGGLVLAAVWQEPVGVLVLLLGVSLRAVPFWLPLLGLIWLIMAQALERRRGDAVANASRGSVAPGAADD